LGVLPLADVAPIVTWIALVLALGALFVMPWLPGAPPALPVAVVDPAHCNGCTWCFADCPYGAITMVPHPSARAGGRLARVDADLCAGCGVCVGACPSATPFRRGAPLATGIDLPEPALAALRARLDAALDSLDGLDVVKVVVLGCDSAARLDTAALPGGTAMLGAPCTAGPNECVPPGTVMLTAPCTGQWPPVFIEYALRRGADGVLVTGCPPGDCQWRLGARWVEQRLAGERQPPLRARVPRERVRLHWALTEDKADLLREVQALHRALVASPRQRVPQDA
ncbi:MAG TPA: hydrogenase iron-sulfur subunit, partial [Burkholderiaceae bacterium]|nr:hydrogenase iron-sulfur subunit [Burkholderiaceae bacterium]